MNLDEIFTTESIYHLKKKVKAQLFFLGLSVCFEYNHPMSKKTSRLMVKNKTVRFLYVWLIITVMIDSPVIPPKTSLKMINSELIQIDIISFFFLQNGLKLQYCIGFNLKQ